MPRLVSAATGNWNSAATWGVVDETSSLMLTTSPTSVNSPSTTPLASAAFNPGVITIAGFCVFLAVKSGGTGTITLELHDGTSVVASASVSQTDFPAADSGSKNGGWVYFKFASPYTTAAVNHTLRLVNTSSSNIPSFYTNGTTNNWLRLAVTTTTQAPAAGDEMFVVGDGPTDTKVVTFNETTATVADFASATDYGVAATNPPNEIGAITISAGAKLAFANSTSTNYTLRCSSNIVVFSGGELTVGTSASPIPRTSTAWVGLDNAAAGDADLIVKNGGTLRGYGESPTAGKNVVRTKLTANLTASQNTDSSPMSVADDTGWKSGSEIVLAGTNKVTTNATAYEWERLTLSSDAGASTLSAGTLTYAHEGTAPFQAYLIMLSRNVGIRSVSTTVVGAIDIQVGATFDSEWTAYQHLGSTTGTGVYALSCILTSSYPSSLHMRYCALFDIPGSGLRCQPANTLNVDDECALDDNVFHNIGSTVQGSSWLVTTSVHGTYRRMGTFNRNTLIGAPKVSGRYANISISANLESQGNVVANLGSGNGGNNCSISNIPGAGSYGVVAVHAPFDWEFFSCYNSNGAVSNVLSTTLFQGGYTSFALKVWRTNSDRGLTLSGMVLDKATLEFYGCRLLAQNCQVEIDSLTVLSDGVTTPANAIAAYIGPVDLTVKRLLTADSGSLVGPTVDVSLLLGENYAAQIKIQESNRAVTLEDIPTKWAPYQDRNFIAVQRDNDTDNSAWTQFAAGRAALDTTIKDGGSGASMRVTPSNATYPVKVPVGRVTVADGATRTISLKMRASEAVADGADYAGYGSTYPRLMAKANPAIGLTADVQIGIMTTAYLPGGASEGTWETVSGALTATGGGNFIDNGQVELYVECLGTTGWINVDTLAVS